MAGIRAVLPVVGGEMREGAAACEAGLAVPVVRDCTDDAPFVERKRRIGMLLLGRELGKWMCKYVEATEVRRVKSLN